MQPKTFRAIVWPLAWGVVALQCSLLLGWIIYRAYQPVLLETYQLKSFILLFSLLPGLLAAVIEPLSGWLSDRLIAQHQGRLVQITSGVVIAGLVFVSIAVLLAQESGAVRGLLPVLMVAWMIAIQFCASPTLALLSQTAPIRRLPQVAALLTLSSGLLGALEPLLGRWASRIGPSGTFLLGGVVLGVGLGVLRGVSPPAGRSPVQPVRQTPFPLRQALLLFAVGLAVSFETNVLLFLLPRVRAISLPGLPNEAIATGLLMLSALLAPFMGRLATHWGDRRSLLWGVVGLTVLLGLALVLPMGVVPLLLVGLAGVFSLITTSLIAVSLHILPPAYTGLGSGLYLGSTGAAAALAIAHFGISGRLALPPVLLGLGLSGAIALGGVVQLNREPG